MSIRYMTAVWDRTDLTDRTSLLILLALADFANDKGESWPAISTLAKQARCSPRTAQRLLVEMTLVGLLEVIPNQGIKGTNRYRLTLQNRGGDTVTGGCHSCVTGGGDILTGGGDIAVSPGGVTKTPLRGDIAVSPDPSGTVSTEPSLDPSVGLPDADASVAVPKNSSVGPEKLKASESGDPELVLVSPRKLLSDGWCAAYLKAFGRPYHFDGSKDGKGLTLLLATNWPVDEILGFAKDAWQHARSRADKFSYSSRAASLHHFAQSFNLIAAEVRPAQVDYSEGFR